MRTARLRILAAAIAPLVLASLAPAGFVGIKVVSKETGDIPGLGALFVCNVYAVFDRPDDEMLSVYGAGGAPLNIFVKQGKWYQDPEDYLLTAPLLQLLPGSSGALAYDTFVTIGTKTDDFFSTLDNVSTTPGLAFSNNSLTVNLEEEVSGAWFIIPAGPGNGGLGAPDANGQVLIFQGSFIKDGIANGIAGLINLSFTSKGIPVQAVGIEFDHQVPGAGALALLVGGLAARRRRR